MYNKIKNLLMTGLTVNEVSCELFINPDSVREVLSTFSSTDKLKYENAKAEKLARDLEKTY